MEYEIELEVGNDVLICTVNEAHFDDRGVVFKGFDPKDCPENMEHLFKFYSKDLTAILSEPDQIEHLDVNIVDEYFVDAD